MTTLSSRLTAEERAFLQQLFRASAEASQAASEFGGDVELVAVDNAGRRLLELLGSMDAVILAEDAEQQLRFRLRVEPCPFGGPGRLRVSAPLISQRYRRSQQKATGATKR
ncbi:MAG: hypothetical protein GX093_04350 [Xanthomonadaceae bacterium]|nr:hypothetical protein [Xanthomonadaceae bacterium]